MQHRDVGLDWPHGMIHVLRFVAKQKNFLQNLLMVIYFEYSLKNSICLELYFRQCMTNYHTSTKILLLNLFPEFIGSLREWMAFLMDVLY